ncbi:hypothetical protein QYE76_061687 [Lolium multiflorum]|uniref:Uncharacterized protein n=1 Tax=Lolium multiflorum TaxID=4521 RepID=A0AAD8S1S1_LOLMU|nr:hypothetical protein QYE76_061687 [Lolium multiflorum]
MADGTPVTYEELPDELKKRYDEIKVTLEADLIGSFERTRSHGIDGRDSHRKEIVWLEKPEDIVGRIAMRRSTSAVPRTSQGAR